MKSHKKLILTQTAPVVSALLLGALACSSDPTGPEETNPFAAQTYDELILAPQNATEPGPSELMVDGGVGEGGAGPIGTGGSGPVGKGGSTSTGGAPTMGGFAGTFGEGGSPSVGGSSSTGGSFGSGGFAGTFGSGGSAGKGSGGSGGQPGFGPSAFWQFDDCSTVTRALLDSSGNGIHAIRTVETECAEGISGQAVAFDAAGDRVEALNAPQFALDQDLAVAAWVNPESTDGNRPVVLKRLQNKTAFSLRVQNGQAQFSVELDNGKTVTSRAPIETGVWSHIAGMFDGQFVFLFINGEQVGQVSAQGSIRDVDVVMRVGGTTQTQRFLGRIDEVFISTNGISKEELAALSCVRMPSTLEISPTSSGPHQPGTQTAYSVSAINNDSPSCFPREYFLETFFFVPEFEVFPDPFFIPQVPPGGRADFTLFVTSSEDAEPGPVQIPFFVTSFPDFESQFGEVEYIVGEPTGCFARTFRELFVKNVAIVDDPIRTSLDGPADDPRTGAWTFGRLMENAAPTPEAAADMVEQVFSTLTTEQVVNSFPIPSRFFAQEVLLDPWPRVDGHLDLARAPLRLLGIANRIDLRNLDNGNAGEGRFIFGVLDQFGFPLEFTVILEYQISASTEDDVTAWAQAWHALSDHPFPSEAYNVALQAITDTFTGRGVAPSRPNGTALLRLRTNEIALDFEWQLREFTFGEDGFLQPDTIKLTPALDFNFTAELGRFINQNEAAILAEQHDVPLLFEGSPFLTGSVSNNIDFWAAPGVENNDARHKMSLNTCNGCHGAETNTFFLQVSPRFQGQESFLSEFMTGTTVFDQVSGEFRQLDDLARRKADLEGLVCPQPAGLQGAASGTSIRKGIGRVH